MTTTFILQLDNHDSPHHGKWYVQRIDQGQPTIYLYNDGWWDEAMPAADTGYFPTREAAEIAMQQDREDDEDGELQARAEQRMWERIWEQQG